MRGAGAAAALLYAALAAAAFRWVLACPVRCFVDLVAVHGPLGALATSDVRLNCWILAWVQHALASDPLHLFRGNVLFPAPDALTGSEHLIGVALLASPLRVLADGPILVHLAAVLLSGWILALGTFALVRWSCGSPGIALVAGAVAELMPWRVTELAHVQLLSAQWTPLIWLLTLRILLGPDRRADPAWLALLLGLQLLSSFYLAFLVTLSLAVLLAVVPIQARRGPRALLRAAAAMLPAYALLLGTAVPYWARSVRGEIGFGPDADPTAGGGFDPEAALGIAWRTIEPVWEPAWSPLAASELYYRIPIAVAILACIGVVASLRRLASLPPERRREAIAVRSLAACCLAAFVLMLAKEIDVAGATFRLPGYWAAKLVPGYANLRAPTRWGILLSLAGPVLAASGAQVLALASARALRAPRARHWMLALLAGLVALGLPLRTLPARDLWPEADALAPAYAALARLPEGPLLEVPWRQHPLARIDADGRAMLGSTLHWRPLLNGFTAYPPASYAFLHRVAAPLPDPEGLDRLRSLVGPRWILVRWGDLDAPGRIAWREASRRAPLSAAYEDDHASILEVAQDPRAGEFLHLLASREPRPTTLGGVSRARLQLGEGAGSLGLAPSDPSGGADRGARRVQIRIENRSAVDWPGFDPEIEGLVAIRVVYARPDGRPLLQRTHPLDADVRAGSSVSQWIEVGTEGLAGSYRACIELVQRLDARPHPLPVARLELAVDSGPARDGGEAAGFIDFARRFAGVRPPESYPCSG